MASARPVLAAVTMTPSELIQEWPSLRCLVEEVADHHVETVVKVKKDASRERFDV